MVGTVLSYLENAIVTGCIGLVCGMVFGPKIKDWLSGVPADLRTALNGVEAKAKADIAAATSKVVTALPAPPPVAKPAAPSPVAVPVAQQVPVPSAPAPAAPHA